MKPAVEGVISNLNE